MILFKKLSLLLIINFLIILSSYAQEMKQLGYMLKNPELKLDVLPTFEGGKKKLIRFTHNELYKSNLYNDFFHKKTSGYIYAIYTIDTSGTAKEISINIDKLTFNKKIYTSDEIDTLSKEIVVLIHGYFSQMPQWSPAILNGKKVAVDIVSPIIINP